MKLLIKLITNRRSNKKRVCGRYAPENCLYLIEKLGLLTNEQKRAKDKTLSKQSARAKMTDGCSNGPVGICTLTTVEISPAQSPFFFLFAPRCCRVGFA
jgi:hypothetical protein